MAAEHNVDISAIPGTGLAGRVTKNDILGYIEGGAAGRGAAGQRRPPRPRHRAVPPAVPAAPLRRRGPTVEPWPGDRVEPWSRIRKLTADHMVMSRRVSPHVNTIFEIDYTRVAQLRARKKKEYADRGVNLTYLAFITKVGGRQPPEAPGAQLRRVGREHPVPARHQHRHRRRARLGTHRAGHQARRRALAAGHRPRHQRSGRAGPDQEAEPGRGAEGHIHHHQPRRVRVGDRHADHQPAPGGDPLRRDASRSSPRSSPSTAPT